MNISAFGLDQNSLFRTHSCPFASSCGRAEEGGVDDCISFNRHLHIVNYLYYYMKVTANTYITGIKKQEHA